MPRPHPLLLDLAALRTPRSATSSNPASVLASAIEHRISGLLWTSIERGVVDMPAAQTHELAARDLVVQAHHERLWSLASEIQHRLRRIGVESAIAKGIGAETRWYVRTGERPCRDIDLVVDPAATARVDDVLAELAPRHPMRPEIAEMLRTGVLQSVDLVVDGVPIDLHVDLLKVEVATRGRAALFERSIEVTGSHGSTIRVLDAETSLILFAIHLNKDRFARLLGYADIARLLAREPFDWPFVETFLAREGLRMPVYAALHAVSSDIGLRPPPVPRPRGARARAWNRLWPPDQRLRGYVSIGTNEHRQLWIPWLAEGRIREAFRWWVRRRAVPPRELLRIYEPDVGGPYPVQWAVGRLRGWRRRGTAERLAREADVHARHRRSSSSTV
jgi:hypothetical protein